MCWKSDSQFTTQRFSWKWRTAALPDAIKIAKNKEAYICGGMQFFIRIRAGKVRFYGIP